MVNAPDGRFPARRGLRDLFEAWEVSAGKAAFERAARVLGRRARGRAFTRRYVLSVWNGRLEAGEPFRQALAAELAELDGADPRAGLTAVTTWAANPDLEGAMLGRRVRWCRECSTPFSPNHPNRRYCYRCRPEK